MKNRVKTIAKSGENKWKDKVLSKWFVQFEDGTNGTLTTGFDETLPPAIGDELEYELEDKGFGMEIKLPRKGGAGFGGGKKWTPDQVAQQDAVKLTSAAFSAGLNLNDWKRFFIECKQFMLHQEKEGITETELGMPTVPDKPAVKEDINGEMPF